MNEEITYFKHFYQQASLDADLLEKNATDYPYSSLAGFLLLYHYRKTNHPGFEKLSKKTALYFTNPNWLQFLLDQTPGEKNGTTVSNLQNVAASNGQGETNSGDAEILHEENSLPGTDKPTEPIQLPAENFEIASEEAGENPEILPAILAEQDFPEKQVTTVDSAGSPEGEISFEPLHTVDYFASQGIKITEEPVSNDKLGNQVKSFTAWLKSMKKVHPAKQGEQDAAIEKLIQNSAEESNISTEVYTEAMAEVLVKQDKKEKAIEMYTKLSLLNPSKSAYFAGKIDQIKSS